MNKEFKYFQKDNMLDFSFIKVPREIIRGTQFSNISLDARFLYIAMLERQSLSLKNGWTDDNGNVYIIFSQKDAGEVLSCSRSKLTKIYAELDTENGEGLIKRKRQGLGKPDIIYLNFSCVSAQTKESAQGSENSNSTDLGLKTAQPDECNKSNKMFKNKTSDCANLTQPDDLKTDTNYINNNKNKINKNKSINPSYHINPYNWLEERHEYTEIIKQNISYNSLIENCRKSIIDDIIHTMVNAVCSQNDFIFVGGEYVPKEEVKKRFLTMNSIHIESVYKSLIKNKSSVRNINAFLLTCLYRGFNSANVLRQINANREYSSFMS